MHSMYSTYMHAFMTVEQLQVIRAHEYVCLGVQIPQSVMQMSYVYLQYLYTYVQYIQ